MLSSNQRWGREKKKVPKLHLHRREMELCYPPLLLHGLNIYEINKDGQRRQVQRRIKFKGTIVFPVNIFRIFRVQKVNNPLHCVKSCMLYFSVFISQLKSHYHDCMSAADKLPNTNLIYLILVIDKIMLSCYFVNGLWQEVQVPSRYLIKVY